MQVLKSAALYFALVFGTGFLLGPIRVLWAVPRFGARAAELMEAPIMLVAIFFTARFVVRRFAVAPLPSRRLAIGLLALAALLVTELTLVLRLRGLTVDEYLAHRDPAAGMVYAISLGVFAAMPLFVGRT